jgi:predicted ATPase
MVESVVLPTISNRYRLLNQIGQGGMGAVYRAVDRLSGQPVALKRVTMPGEQLQFGSRVSSGATADFRLALAQEFRTLASMRHPHIISVLDYGFDEDRQPYFTMELLEQPQTLVAYGQGKQPERQLELLTQMLQALLYLHRRSVIHRDLKPDNVMVVADAVKVLDFGLAVAREHLGETNETVGTLAYMAPEVLQGAPASEAADLYAVGVIAYELFSGTHPFATDSTGQLVQSILYNAPDTSTLDIHDDLRGIIQKLLAKTPAERYADVSELLDAFAAVTGQNANYESATIRESFLQAAQFVGRENELTILTAALDGISGVMSASPRGATWLIGGESGVGKSRLLDELRTQALVRGVLVLRGQAASDGRLTFQLWREAVRWLCLQTTLTDLEASVLKPIVPDIATLIGRDVADAPVLEAQATHDRMLTVIETVVKRQKQPVMLILEDLHWSADEDLSVLNRLTRAAHDIPLLLIGSYRDDERPDLPTLVSGAQTVKLNRLDTTTIAELSSSMLGEAGREPKIVELLQRETEGNIFFLVEVVRALAESAGRLDRVGAMKLPSKVFAGGMQVAVQRRLSRIPPAAYPLLQAAAVFGRELDLNILRALDAQLNLDEWLTLCSAAAVLDVQDERWRFAHDKLREGLLLNLPDDLRPVLHRQVAEAVETIYPHKTEYAVKLAYHWANAGDLDKERHYSALAGERARHDGRFTEATTLLERALELSISNPVMEQVQLKLSLGEAYSGLGKYTLALAQLESALVLLKHPVPATRLGLRAATLKELAVQVAHRLGIQPRPRAAVQQHIAMLALIYNLLGQLYYFHNQTESLAYVALRMLNLLEPFGSSPNLARAYVDMCMGMATTNRPNYRLADVYARLAEQTARDSGDLAVLAWVMETAGVYKAGRAQWAEAYRRLDEAVRIAREVAEYRILLESSGVIAFIAFDFNQSLKLALDAGSLARQQNSLSLENSFKSNLAFVYYALDQLDQAIVAAESALSTINDIITTPERILAYGVASLIYWRAGDLERARHYADTTLMYVSKGVSLQFYILDGYTGMLLTYVRLFEASRDSSLLPSLQSAVKAFAQFARLFPVALPRALLSEGLYNFLTGDLNIAYRLCEKSIQTAHQLEMPYDEGLAHLETALHLHPTDPRRVNHLHQAVPLLESINAVYDLKRVQAALEASH